MKEGAIVQLPGKSESRSGQREGGRRRRTRRPLDGSADKLFDEFARTSQSDKLYRVLPETYKKEVV